MSRLPSADGNYLSMSKQGKWNNHLKSYVNFGQGRRWPIFNGSWRGERWGTAPTCVGLEGSHYCVTSSARFYSFVCKLIVIFVHQQNPGCWEKLKRCCLGFLPSCSKKPAVQVNIRILKKCHFCVQETSGSPSRLSTIKKACCCHSAEEVNIRIPFWKGLSKVLLCPGNLWQYWDRGATASGTLRWVHGQRGGSRNRHRGGDGGWDGRRSKLFEQNEEGLLLSFSRRG